MRWLLTLLSIVVAHHALANAKLTVGAMLETEQVTAIIQDEAAIVTGRFRFRTFSVPDAKARDYGQVYFPLVCAQGTPSTLADFQFSLKLNGRAAAAYSIATNSPVAVPPSALYSIVWILATAPVEAINSWNIEVSYRQKLLDGVFHYLPILGKARPSSEAFQILVKADRPIRSTGKGPGGVIAKGAQELLFIPVNLRMISVAVDPPHRLNSSPKSPLTLPSASSGR